MFDKLVDVIIITGNWPAVFALVGVSIATAASIWAIAWMVKGIFEILTRSL